MLQTAWCAEVRVDMSWSSLNSFPSFTQLLPSLVSLHSWMERLSKLYLFITVSMIHCVSPPNFTFHKHGSNDFYATRRTVHVCEKEVTGIGSVLGMSRSELRYWNGTFSRLVMEGKAQVKQISITEPSSVPVSHDREPTCYDTRLLDLAHLNGYQLHLWFSCYDKPEGLPRKRSTREEKLGLVHPRYELLSLKLTEALSPFI